MADAQTELTKLIDRMVEQKTFSLDALQAIKDVRDKAVTLEAALAKATDKIAEGAKRVDELIKSVSDRDAALKAWSQREAELANREKTITELEKKTAVAEAHAAAWQASFRTIFANTMVRETISRDVPVRRASGSGGNTNDYIERHQSTEHVSKTEEPTPT